MWQYFVACLRINIDAASSNNVGSATSACNWCSQFAFCWSVVSALILVLPDYPQFSLLSTFGICMLHSTATINFMRGSPPPLPSPHISLPLSKAWMHASNLWQQHTSGSLYCIIHSIFFMHQTCFNLFCIGLLVNMITHGLAIWIVQYIWPIPSSFDKLGCTYHSTLPLACYINWRWQNCFFVIQWLKMSLTWSQWHQSSPLKIKRLQGNPPSQGVFGAR